ncbi:MAG: winged helix-turn-helix domain-containing protein, partial [Verrucomicrobiales bacterium]|nr:winged helix-turn-helix domain-containing protein [Verrucomicrobiales bacterium]
GQRYFGTTRTLDQVIVALRRKLGDSADAPRHLHTVHGVGYRFEP